MAYGLKWTGKDGNLCISSEEKSLYCIGSPTLNSSFYISDETGEGYWKNVQTGTSGTTTEAAGVKKITVYNANPGYCGYGKYWTYNTPDEMGAFTFLIYSQVKPLIYIYSASGYHATVIGVEATGNTHGTTGYAEWSIQVVAVYPTGTRTNLWNNIDLYCFDVVNDTGDTYGIQVFTASGDLAFMNTDAPMVIKDILEITAITTGLSMTADTLVGALTDLGNLSKPAFLATDFSHYRVIVSGAAQTVGYRQFHPYPPPGSYSCEGYVAYYPIFEGAGIFGGLRYNAVTEEIDAAGFTTEIVNMSVTTSSPTTGVTNVYHELPAYIPIIDGADYD